MDVTNYDFESKLEQGFKSLFNTAGINLYIADNVDEVLPDENVRFELSVGGVISDEHLKQGNYDNYGGSIEIQIQTPRVSDDQVAISEGVESYVVAGAGTTEVNSLDYTTPFDLNGKPYYTSPEGGFISWVSVGSPQWQIGAGFGSFYKSEENVATPDLVTTWIEITGAPSPDGQLPVPTVTKSPPLQFKSRQAELVAITRKTIEEIDASVLLANWPNALSPIKIKPTGTERENDADHRVTKLSYEIQFRIT